MSSALCRIQMAKIRRYIIIKESIKKERRKRWELREEKMWKNPRSPRKRNRGTKNRLGAKGRAKFGNVVRGFSLVRTTLKGHTTKEKRASQWCKGDEIASSLLLLAMTKGMRHCEPFLLSLRAEGVAISHEGHYYSNEIAELVPSEMRNLLLRVCFGYASQPLSLLAMTERGG